MKKLKTEQNKNTSKKIDITRYAHLVSGGTGGQQRPDEKTQQTTTLLLVTTYEQPSGGN